MKARLIIGDKFDSEVEFPDMNLEEAILVFAHNEVACCKRRFKYVAYGYAESAMVLHPEFYTKESITIIEIK